MSNYTFKEYANTVDSRAVKKGPCADCGSSDGKVLFSDGHSYCFVHQQYYPSGDKHEYVNNNTPMTRGARVEAITDRNIKLETVKKYGVSIDIEGGDITKHYYPYYDDNGKQVAVKVRVCATKDMFINGSNKEAGLFGQNVFPKGGRSVTIVEGEVDAMSAYELTGSKYPVLSVRNGVQGAVRDCKASFEYLNSFDTIVICMDNDEHGKAIEGKIAALFEPKKCKIMKMSYKDPNEYLKAGKREEFVNDWFRASVYTPAGIMNLKDIGDDLYEEASQQTILWPWSGLNDMLYGIRTGELVTLTAGTGTGKSSAIRELIHHMLQDILKKGDDNIGILSLEENVKQTCFHLMSVEANARLNIREVRAEYSREQLKAWEAATIGTGRLFAFDHFGSLDNDDILDRVRYMVKAMDCKWILLDHLSILVSGQEGGDERRSIDILMTKLRSLVEETQCSLILVSHLKRTSKEQSAEEGASVSLSHLRGSQSIAQLSDCVISMERNQQAEGEMANITTMRVLKSRYTGETGIATYLKYNKATGRLTETEPFENEEGNDFKSYGDV